MVENEGVKKYREDRESLLIALDWFRDLAVERINSANPEPFIFCLIDNSGKLKIYHSGDNVACFGLMKLASKIYDQAFFEEL